MIEQDNGPYFVAVRDDGSGSRFLSLLNAFYLASMIASEKNVKFFWNDSIVIYKDAVSADKGNNFRQVGQQRVIGSSIEKKEEVFTEEFIEKFFLENTYSYNTNWLFSKTTYPKEIFEVSTWFGKLTLKDIKDKFDNKEFKLFFVHHSNMAQELHLDFMDYRRKTEEIWKKIGFVPKLKQVMDMALSAAQSLNKNFNIIHLRSGDSIYSYCNLRKFNLQSVYHAALYELSIALVEKKMQGENVVIVGDDLDSIEHLVRVIDKKNVISIEKFRKSEDFSTLELFLFDVVFMSEAKKIYGTFSAVIRLSELINSEVKLYNYYEIFDIQEQYKIVKENFKKLNLHPDQKAFSLFHTYLLAKKNNLATKILQSYLYQALEYDDDNDKYRIHIVDCFLRDKQFDKAEEYLKNVFKTRKHEYLETLLLHGWEGVVYAEVFDNYFSAATDQYPNTLLVAQRILEERYGAEYRIKNYFCYKLGQQVIGLKKISNILKFPYSLYKLIQSQKSKKQRMIKLPPIETYKDYDRALKIKRHLSYRIGLMLVDAHKNWWRGGYIIYPVNFFKDITFKKRK
ncbi:hypothetical protein [Campylobacter sp. MIT 97-5078]|uniref:hypothetical protein n=1 Tax=Campylobacter sp. MIT 97-5078 TaxID=1548153 RepID=UPI0005138701|nr:hypothetical protein [Campylobacter sp. MIT 97-5078]KGI55461.1 hypothetical protein LR59_11980 [Campylobacter sp. MIT 97-5078]TQR23256.1 hypothetical protein DMB91_08120 [Campylobacter sp. MIT 97-5078]